MVAACVDKFVCSAKQDGPRPGGFPPVRYRRDMATRGPSGFAMFFASAAVITYGMYTVGQGNIMRRLVVPLCLS